jgi:Sulfotransferase family
MPLPTLVVVGAMKCGTSALHRYLDRHPEIAMARGKELNFFYGPEQPPDDDPGTWWRWGQWHRGPEWYASCFDGRYAVRGEASPGYTDPGNPEVAARMAALVPDVRLVCLVREPLDRALSQWRHHVRDRTETRPLAPALLDPASQYVARSRYRACLEPFLREFPRPQLLVVVQERLLADRRRELARVFAHAGADPAFWSSDLEPRVHVGGGRPEPVPDDLRTAFGQRVAADLAGLRELLDDELPEWR